MRRMAVVVPAALVASLLAAAWHAGAVSVYYAFGGPGGVVMPGPGGTAEGGDQLGAAME